MNKIKKALFIIGYFIIQFIPFFVFCLSVELRIDRYCSIWRVDYTVLAAVLIFSLCVKKFIRNNYSENVDIVRITLLVLNFVLIGIMFFVFGFVLNF